MTFLESMQRVVESDSQLQELVEEIEQVASLVLPILLKPKRDSMYCYLCDNTTLIR